MADRSTPTTHLPEDANYPAPTAANGVAFVIEMTDGHGLIEQRSIVPLSRDEWQHCRLPSIAKTRGKLRDIVASVEFVGVPDGGVAFDLTGKGGDSEIRRMKDDAASGRLWLWYAKSAAEMGIAAADEMNGWAALACLIEAQKYLIDALLSTVRPDDIANLGKPARRRGRPKKVA
jgi:hypothetical protein